MMSSWNRSLVVLLILAASRMLAMVLSNSIWRLLPQQTSLGSILGISVKKVQLSIRQTAVSRAQAISNSSPSHFFFADLSFPGLLFLSFSLSGVLVSTHR